MVPGIGCASIFSSIASAGGQLEQPSEVNSSTRMGNVSAAAASDRFRAFAISQQAKIRVAVHTHPMRRVTPLYRSFCWLSFTGEIAHISLPLFGWRGHRVTTRPTTAIYCPAHMDRRQ